METSRDTISLFTMFFLISPSTSYNNVPLFIENPWQQLVHLLANDLNLNIKENVDKIGKIYQYPPHPLWLVKIL